MLFGEFRQSVFACVRVCVCVCTNERHCRLASDIRLAGQATETKMETSKLCYIVFRLSLVINTLTHTHTHTACVDARRSRGSRPRKGKINYFKRFRIANCRLSFQKTYLATHISVNDYGDCPGHTGNQTSLSLSLAATVCVCANLK